jgi:hypothetical protein
MNLVTIATNFNLADAGLICSRPEADDAKEFLTAPAE